jgi:hypothetical protein
MATLKSGLNSGAGFNSSDTITSTTLNNHVNDGGIVAGTILTADMADSSSKITGVTFAKMQHIDAEKVLARTTAGEGDIEEIDIAGASGILLDEDTMSSDSATRGATQQSIKAYVDGMRPKYVTATAGTLALTLTNRSADAVYNIADFTATGESGFATDQITGIVVDGFVRSAQGVNQINAVLPGGVETRIVRVAANSTADDVQIAASFTVPVNSDTTSVTFKFTVNDSSHTTYNKLEVRGFIIQPNL